MAHTCGVCGGTGYKTCPRCNGAGRFDSGEVCYFCQGAKKVECTVCEGGKVED